MDDKHIGSVISADTNDGSVYQGKLTTLEPNNRSITMANVIKDGLPLHRCVTLCSSEIARLRVIRAPSSIVPGAPAPAPAPNPAPAPPTARKLAPPPHQNQRPLVRKPVSSSSPSSLSLASSSSAVTTEQPPKKLVMPPKSKGKTPKKSELEKLFEAHNSAPSSAPMSPKQSKSRPKNLRNSPMKNGFTHVTEEISATPMFKSFEPQVPQPKVLSQMLTVTNGAGASRGCSKKQGPSGNPVLDALNHYKGIGRRSNKTDLAEPIDFDLDSDFDFAENLKLFERDEEDDEYYETVEKLKVSQNFAHYENIIEDENRVTSWTNLKARRHQQHNNTSGFSSCNETKKNRFQVTAVSFEKTINGNPIPAISAHEKKEFLKECKSSLGEAVMDALTADRVFQWISEVQASYGDSLGTIVLLAAASNSVRSVRRLLTHFDKRRYNCHLFGKYPGEHFEHVAVVDDVKQLPREAPIICILSPEVNEDVEMWLRAQGSAPHFVCIESVPSVLEPSRCHLLQFGCATHGLRHVERKTAPRGGSITFERLCQPKTQETDTVLVDSAIADLGSPSTWFDDSASKFIATAFTTTFLVRLSQSK